MNTVQIEDLKGGSLTLPNFAENSNATGIARHPDFVKVEGINPQFPYHKLFLYLECNRSVASSDFYVQGSVRLFRNGKPVIVLPASIGTDAANTLLQNSLVTAFANNTNGTNEAILVSLAKSFTTSINPILTPTKVTGIIDRMTYSIENFGTTTTITSFRAYLGAISSLYPF